MLKTFGQIRDSLMEIYSNKAIAQKIHAILTFTRDELKTGLNHSLSIKKRIDMYKKGFLSRNYYLYDFEENDPKFYLSDFTLKAYTTLNDDVNITRNKKKYHDMMRKKNLDDFKPDFLGEIQYGEWDFEEYDNFERLMENEKRAVIKPVFGGGGEDVFVCKIKDDKLMVNDDEINLTNFKKKIKNHQRYIIEEYVEQADFLSKIYPKSSNTIRLWVMNPKNSESFFPLASLRIGTENSGYLDNLNMGGLCSHIDLENGELDLAIEKVDSGKVKWHETHPDTGSNISGKKIEGWEKIKKDIKNILEDLPEIRYAGMDILVTDPGDFIILEMNARPSINLSQVDNPVLKNKKVREFYRNHGVPV